jgi:hypothetical protein
LSASPLLDCGLRAQLRMRPARHGDRSSPTDTTHVNAKCINSTPLSADCDRCQAHFFRTTFCVVNPLAKFTARRSARTTQRASCTLEHRIGKQIFDYLTAGILHNMNALTEDKTVSRRGARDAEDRRPKYKCKMQNHFRH